MLSREHQLLNREAGIAAELIGSGVTLLGRANYAHPDVYGRAFFSLSIGLERAAKIIYIADFAIEHGGRFPSNVALKNVGHDLNELLSHAETIRRRSIKEYSERPKTPIHEGIVQTLAEFAMQSRYYNLDVITGRHSSADPLAAWDRRVIGPSLSDIARPRHGREFIGMQLPSKI
jgi:hypothetical protein